MKKFDSIDALPLTDTGKGKHNDTGTFFAFDLQLIWYLIPIIGFFPSLWTLYRRQGSREQLATCRLSITLALCWLLGYTLLATGAFTSNFLSLRLLILNSFFTSGYFLVSFWLILGTVGGKSKRLPGFSRFAERVVGKYLS